MGKRVSVLRVVVHRPELTEFVGGSDGFGDVQQGALYGFSQLVAMRQMCCHGAGKRAAGAVSGDAEGARV